MNWDKEKDRLSESQKTRDNLMKWKLVIVAAISSAALGFSKSKPLPYSELALCLIPFACCYIDLLCRNLSIRTKMIGQFLAKEGEPLELFYKDFKDKLESNKNETSKDKKEYSLESLALRGSTYFLSAGIIPIGIATHLMGETITTCSDILKSWPIYLFIISGSSGLYLSYYIQKKYFKQRESVYS